MIRGMYFSVLVILIVLLILAAIYMTVNLLWIQEMEFKRRANEIIHMYNDLEEFLIRSSKWSKVMNYPSDFYDVKFQTSKEVIEKMTIMIRDAIKCFKQQNGFARVLTEPLLSELHFIQRKLMIIHVFG